MARRLPRHPPRPEHAATTTLTVTLLLEVPVPGAYGPTADERG